MVFFIVVYAVVVLGTIITAGTVLDETGDYSTPEAVCGAVLIAVFWPVAFIILGVRTVASFTKRNW